MLVRSRQFFALHNRRSQRWRPALKLTTLGAIFSLALGCSDATLQGEPKDAESNSRSSTDDDAPPEGTEEVGVEGIGWTTRYPRLSHAQWENTVRDLLRLEARPGLSDSFSLDPDDSRFDTTGRHIVSGNLWLDYQRAAEELASDIASDSAMLDALVPGASTQEAFVEEFLLRAFRRPASDDELTNYGELFDLGAELLTRGSELASGAELVIATALQSPHFLYRPETSTKATDDRIWLTAFEVANRLSFGLWNTMPTDELLAAAENGELRTEESVLEWAQKMIEDPRSAATLLSFHEQFFHTKDYGTIAKNQTLFPDFTPELAPILREEAHLFFEEITVDNDQGIAELMTSNVSFINEDTAPLYGVQGDFSSELVRTELDSAKRAGILTQIGFLSRFASQGQSDPILRGVHISIDMLCSDLPAPPANIPPLPDFEDDQTNRERVELATGELPCSTCHETLINPIGFAFENYDAVGAWRDEDNNREVDASASYNLDGEVVAYDNAVQLVKLLAESPSLHRCYADAWLEYLMGRPTAEEEEASLLEPSDVSRTSGSASRLLTSLVALDTFRARPKENY